MPPRADEKGNSNVLAQISRDSTLEKKCKKNIACLKYNIYLLRFFLSRACGELSACELGNVAMYLSHIIIQKPWLRQVL